MKDEKIICAQRIAYLRNKKNLKQDELAAIVSELTQREKPYPTTIVNEWENGKEIPSKEAAVAMANLFNTSVDYILGRANTMDNNI
jgi:transcriptional regulator with XRE-family HTH domain